MKSVAGLGRGERCPLTEEGDSPGPRLLSLERRQAAPVWRGKDWPHGQGGAAGHHTPQLPGGSLWRRATRTRW